MARRPKRRNRPADGKRRRRRGSLWRWMGLGALGLAGGLLLKRPTAGRRTQPVEPAAGPGFELPPGIETAWIQGPGGSLRVAEVHPDGEIAIVFVHGLGGCLEQWAPLLGALGPAVHGVAFDLPGHGGSDRDARGDDSLESLAAAIGAVLDGLRLRRAVIVAHSVGATAAIELAGGRPDRVAGLLLVDPTGDQTRLPVAQQKALRESLRREPVGDLLWNYRQLLVEARSDVADHVLRSAEKLDDQLARGILESGLEHSPMPALKRYRGVVRSLQSERNDMPWSLHRLRRDLPHRFVAGASHWLMMDRPDAVWEELVELLDELHRSSGGLASSDGPRTRSAARSL
jgi:pimeloyl-ACP methyl ester carboxylesterase